MSNVGPVVTDKDSRASAAKSKKLAEKVVGAASAAGQRITSVYRYDTSPTGSGCIQRLSP